MTQKHGRIGQPYRIGIPTDFGQQQRSDLPGPIRRSDLDWRLVIEGTIMAVVVFAFIVMASLVDVR